MNRQAWALMLVSIVFAGAGGAAQVVAAEPLGTAGDARAMLDRAVAALRADKDAALQAFNDTNNKDFRDRDLFVYCFDTGDGKFTAYEMSALIGADIRSFKLYNEPMGQRAYDAVHDAPEGTVVSIDYQMAKPGEKTPSAKEALESRIGDQACGVSYFK